MRFHVQTVITGLSFRVMVHGVARIAVTSITIAIHAMDKKTFLTVLSREDSERTAMAIRDTPEHFFGTKMRTQVTAPPQQPLPVQFEYVPPSLQLPEINTTGLIVIGIVAIVGLIGLFALLGSSKKCDR